MEGQKVTFEQVPGLMADLLAQMRSLSKKVDVLTTIKQPDGTPMKPSHRPITINDVVKLSHKCKGTLYRLSCQGKIPCYKNGKHLVFFEDEIIDWLSENRKLSYNQVRTAAEEYCKRHPI